MHRVERGIDEVPDGDIGLGAGAVVETSPAAGSDTTPGQQIEVTTNPERPGSLPDAADDNDPDCDYDTPGSYPPSWNLPGSAFTPAPSFGGTSTLGVEPDVAGAPKLVTLRYGNEGWGRLHIAIGHGWSADAERDSRLAIAFGYREMRAPRFPGGQGRRYSVLLPERNVAAKLCGRRVIAQLAYKPADVAYPDVDGREKGVITSFGLRAR